MSPARLIFAMVLLVVGGAVALDSARSAFVFASRATQPSAALSIAPNDAVASAKQFELELAKGEVQFPDADWIARARVGLAQDPLNAGILRVLGYAVGKGTFSDTKALPIVRMAEQVSRRDLLTQLWLIESSVAANDIPGALRHYDRALSVYPESAQSLFDVLMSALSAPEIRAGIAPYMRANRPWAKQFLTHLVANAPDLRMVADLFRDYGGVSRVPDHRLLESQLLYRLAERGYPDYGREIVHRLGGRGSVLGHAGFSAATSNPAYRPLSWVVGESEDVHGQIDGDGLRARASAGSRGAAATRVMLLAPGRWTLSQTIEQQPDTPAARVTWIARCVQPGSAAPVWEERFPVDKPSAQFRSSFVVDARCRGISFEVVVVGDELSDAEIKVRGVTLTRS